MSKNKKGPDFSKATPALVKQVKDIITECDVRHTFSTSKITKAYESAFAEKMPGCNTCASSLRMRVNELRKWLKEYDEYVKTLKGQTPPNPEYVQAYGLQDGTILYTQKGLLDPPLCSKDGVVIGDGEYILKDNSTIVVSSGAIVTILEPIEPQYTDPDAPGYVHQVEGTVRYPMAEGIPFDFLPNEGTLVKGIVTLADGSSIKPGTYVTAENLKIAVQPGGKATLRDKTTE